jgi:GTP cyclohydrolase I
MSDNKLMLTHSAVLDMAKAQAQDISEWAKKNGRSYVNLWGVPRGGIPAMYAVSTFLGGAAQVTEHPDKADFIIDDIIDSGSTLRRMKDGYPKAHFVALVDKREPEFSGRWVIFPWEESEVGSAEDIVIRLLQFIGEDPTREGLRDTPKRVLKAWAEWCKGYTADPKEILKAFEDGAERYDEMVMVKDIPIYSHCEHHLAPFFGTVTIAYVPDGHIIGLSKLSRLADIFSKRLQVQERLTSQIADALVEALNPRGVGVVIKARHLCMESRGICKQGELTVTSAVRGVFKDKPEARAEFLDLAR